MKLRLTKKEAHKLSHCPKCDVELEDHALMFITPHCYCPNCDILKMEMLSLPWLCSECDSKLYTRSSDFSEKSEWNECFLCSGKMRGIKIKTFHKYLRKGKLKRGYFVSIKGLPKRIRRDHDPNHKLDINYHRHNETIFTIKCLDCDYKLYLTFPVWRQKELGALKKKVIIKTEVVGNEDN